MLRRFDIRSFEIQLRIFRVSARAEGISALEVEPPLATAVDPDSLNTLIESMSEEVPVPRHLVEFSCSGHRVTVTADGDVSVADRDSDSETL